VIEARQEYLDFARYDAGIMLPEQLAKDVFEQVLFVDARDAGQCEKETIPGAVNIEWRRILARCDEFPTDRKVVLFCNTGARSSGAVFALRVAGMDNVAELQTGICGWLENAPYKPR